MNTKLDLTVFYEIPDDPVSLLFSIPSIPPRFTIAIATTRKQYKVLAANKCSATFYGRRCSFYCHTESRFIERILFFPPSSRSPPVRAVPEPEFYRRVLPSSRDAEQLSAIGTSERKNVAITCSPSLDHPYYRACPSCTM